jgi:alkylation response protein AidB-like acyl-CoA dehydrogenase
MAREFGLQGLAIPWDKDGIAATRTTAMAGGFPARVFRDAPGLTRELLSTLDLTRKQARLTLDEVSARLIGPEGGAWPAIQRTLQLAAVALAADQVGGAQRVLETAVEYAKLRVQFGRPIGSFQAIKHKCANMLLAAETARSAAYLAARCADQPNEDLPWVTSFAKA